MLSWILFPVFLVLAQEAIVCLCGNMVDSSFLLRHRHVLLILGNFCVLAIRCGVFPGRVVLLLLAKILTACQLAACSSVLLYTVHRHTGLRILCSTEDADRLCLRS